MELSTHTSVEEYFHGVVQEALERVELEVTTGAEFYLVQLLGRFASARLTDEPLALKLARAHGDPAERVKTLEEVGDTTLYVTGFFAESLEKRMIDAGYYMNLGEAAYRELAQRLSRSGSIAEIYRELAAGFPRFVDVLAEIRTQVAFASGDVVTLYQQWMNSRESYIERRLRGLGVLVGDGSGYVQ